jgi:hypothetical protein
MAVRGRVDRGTARRRPGALVVGLVLAVLLAPAGGLLPASAATGPTGSGWRAGEQQAAAAARCREVRRLVKLTYRLVQRPTGDGDRLIWVRLVIRNDSDRQVFIGTGGRLRMRHPGADRPQQFQWGGSSADGFDAGAHRTARNPILLTAAEQRVRVPADYRVTRFTVYSYAIPGPGAHSCRMPTGMRAPQGRVVAHPCGRWYLRIQDLCCRG